MGKVGLGCAKGEVRCEAGVVATGGVEEGRGGKVGPWGGCLYRRLEGGMVMRVVIAVIG